MRGKGCKALPTTAPPPPKGGGDFGKCQGKGDTEPGGYNPQISKLRKARAGQTKASCGAKEADRQPHGQTMREMPKPAYGVHETQ